MRLIISFVAALSALALASMALVVVVAADATLHPAREMNHGCSQSTK